MVLRIYKSEGNSMFFSINMIPSQKIFYQLLENISELANKSVISLQQLALEENAKNAYTLGREIETIKQTAKEVTQEMTERLCKALITPFDHEDVYRVSHDLYKIIKICEKVQERLIAFQLRPFQNDFFKLTSNMIEASHGIHDLVKHLKKYKDSKPVHDKCALIHNIEANTDKLLNQLTIDLYHNVNDFKQILIRKDIYDLMENIVDKHRDIANVILEIVMKHS